MRLVKLTREAYPRKAHRHVVWVNPDYVVSVVPMLVPEGDDLTCLVNGTTANGEIGGFEIVGSAESVVALLMGEGKTTSLLAPEIVAALRAGDDPVVLDCPNHGWLCPGCGEGKKVSLSSASARTRDRIFWEYHKILQGETT